MMKFGGSAPTERRKMDGWISYEEAGKEPDKYAVALRLASPGDMIPRSATLLCDRESTEEDIARAHELAEKHGWE